MGEKVEAASSTTPTERDERRSKVGATIPSDTLKILRELGQHLPHLKPLLGEIPRITLVLDANILLNEVRWRTRKRADTGSRTHLEELVASGVVIAMAPAFAIHEVELHLRRVAAAKGISAETVDAIWAEVRSWVKFYHPEEPVCYDDGYERARAADPKDVPYYAAWRQLGATAIYSRDSDLLHTDATVAAPEIILDLRNSARGAAVQLTLKLSGFAAVFVGFAAVKSLFGIASTATKALTRLPTWVKISLGMGIVALFAHPRSRAAILDGTRDVPKRFAGALKVIMRIAGEMVASYSDHTPPEGGHWNSISRLTAGQRPRSARQFVRAALAGADEPLNVAELVSEMRACGYTSRSAKPANYIRELLRADHLCHEVSPGRWVILRERAIPLPPANIAPPDSAIAENSLD